MEKYYGIVLLAIAINIIYWKFVSLVFVLVFAAFYRKQLSVILKNLRRDSTFIYQSFITTQKLKRYARDNITVVKAFKKQLRKGADRPCFYFEDEVWTFQDVENFSNRIANVFKEKGYKKHDAVGLMMGNCSQYVCIWFGLAKLGVRTALINTNLRSKSLGHCITVTKAKAVIYSDEFLEAINTISSELEQNTVEKYQYGGTVVNDEAKDLKVLMSDVKDEAPIVEEPPSFTDIMLYIFTSGTTGLPKAALLPHSRLISVVVRIRTYGRLTENDILYIPLPLYHTIGGCIGIGNALLFGNSIVLCKRFSASSYISDCIKYKTTAGYYVGEMCRYIMATPPGPQDKQHCMRTLLGIGMRTTIWEKFIDRFQIPNIVELYGATEGNVIIGNIDGKVGAVGCIPQCLPWSVIPFTIIKVNEETGGALRDDKGFCIRCKPNEQGMVIGFIDDTNPLRQFHGYLSETATVSKMIYNVFEKGEQAFVSGDLVVTDEDGYIYFKDRIGDTYRWKSENVSTTEVEAVLMNVTGFKCCVVYGIQVGDLEGKAGMAALADPNEELSLSQVAEDLHSLLPKYAMPLFIRISDSIPVTGTFKMQKTELQKEGFNPRLIKDKLYFLQDSNYVPLTEDLYEDIILGRCRI